MIDVYLPKTSYKIIISISNEATKEIELNYENTVIGNTRFPKAARWKISGKCDFAVDDFARKIGEILNEYYIRR